MSNKYERYFWDLVSEHEGEVTRTKNHIVIRFPHGKSMTAPKSPSDWREWRNQIRDIKRALGITKLVFREGERRHTRTRKEQTTSTKPLLSTHTPAPKRADAPPPPRDIDTGDRIFPANIHGVIAHAPRYNKPRGRPMDLTTRKYSTEVLKHAEYLLHTEGAAAMSHYLTQTQSQLERKTTPMPNPTSPSSEMTELVKGPVEKQIEEARYKAIRLRQEAQVRMAEADQLEGFASKLSEALDALTGATTVTVSRPYKPKKARAATTGVMQAIVDHLRQVGHPIRYRDVRRHLVATLGITDSGAYGSISSALRNGSIIKVDDNLALPEWTNPSSRGDENKEERPTQ